MLKVVLDTNQFISGVISKEGPPARLLEAWRKHLYIVITSREILKEIEQVLRYPRIREKYRLRDEEIKSILVLIEDEAIVLPKTPQIKVIKEDPDDNKILACALEVKANYIVSGDRHLLNLGRYKKTIILTARDFLKVIEKG